MKKEARDLFDKLLLENTNNGNISLEASKFDERENNFEKAI